MLQMRQQVVDVLCHYELGLLTVSSALPMLVPRLCVVAPECIFVTTTRTPSALVRLARMRSLERLRNIARWRVAASVLGYDGTGHDVRFFFLVSLSPRPPHANL